VRDGIFFTKAGLPTLVFVNDFFERAARAQAQALGMPELKIYVYPQHKSGDFDAEESAKGVKAARDLGRLLEQRRS
jgi:hypothetical protein